MYTEWATDIENSILYRLSNVYRQANVFNIVSCLVRKKGSRENVGRGIEVGRMEVVRMVVGRIEVGRMEVGRMEVRRMEWR